MCKFRYLGKAYAHYKIVICSRPDGMPTYAGGLSLIALRGKSRRCGSAESEAVPRLALRKDSPANSLERLISALQSFDRATALYTALSVISLMECTFDSVVHSCVPVICLANLIFHTETKCSKSNERDAEILHFWMASGW